MNRIALVHCSKSKTDDPYRIPASERYDSNYFNKLFEAAESIDGDTAILSAKYGAIWPKRMIPDYNVSIYDLSAREIDEWAERVARRLRGYDEVVFLTSKAYREPVEPRLDAVVIDAFETAGGIGEQMGIANEIIDGERKYIQP